MVNMEEYLKNIDNTMVLDALVKSKSVFDQHQKAVVSISGGSDSDLVLDLVEKTKGNTDVIYTFYNTGIEYQATKDHLKYLESKYGVKIQTVPPVKPIPVCVKQFGVPFVSKYVSKSIRVLQIHGFKWEDKPFEVLMKEYEGCEGALRWWCNAYPHNEGEKSRYNIHQNKWLKEFMVLNPPTFNVSDLCCTYAKKKPAKNYLKESGADLNVLGVRRSEGGIRSMTYKNCFSKNEDGADQYRPLFWMSDSDKEYYEKKFEIVHSDCYTKYGLKRTGCVGCPFSQEVFEDLERIKKHEPRMYQACMNVFGESYAYTKKYKEFYAKMEALEESKKYKTAIQRFKIRGNK